MQLSVAPKTGRDRIIVYKLTSSLPLIHPNMKSPENILRTGYKTNLYDIKNMKQDAP